MSIKYRPEIDGLRAIAVLLVVLYHLEIPFITGGFIGVDVFFVISGYLITSILLKDIKNNEYSLLRFYERRIKRILPALFAVITISLVAAWFILFPADFKYFGRSVAATTIFISNFLFHDESGYFEVSARLVPLLHTWSLAVEEQFYILFPLYLFAIKKLNVNKQFLITLILALASLALSIWAVYNGKESAAFYWLP